jgi:hypothetical protein
MLNLALVRQDKDLMAGLDRLWGRRVRLLEIVALVVVVVLVALGLQR